MTGSMAAYLPVVFALKFRAVLYMHEPGKTIVASAGPPHGANLESRDCQRSSDGLPTYCSAVKRRMVLIGTASVSLTNDVRPTGILTETDDMTYFG
jgi:hypothetical protein